MPDAQLNARLDIIVRDLIAIKEQLSLCSEGIAVGNEQHKGLSRILTDHETRIREMEVFVYKMRGAAALYAVGGGLLSGLVLTIISKFM